MQQQPDLQWMMQLIQSEAGRQLAEAIQSNGNDARKAASLAAAGKLDQAKLALSGLLKDPEIQKLLHQLEGQL